MRDLGSDRSQALHRRVEVGSRGRRRVMKTDAGRTRRCFLKAGTPHNSSAPGQKSPILFLNSVCACWRPSIRCLARACACVCQDAAHPENVDRHFIDTVISTLGIAHSTVGYSFPTQPLPPCTPLFLCQLLSTPSRRTAMRLGRGCR